MSSDFTLQINEWIGPHLKPVDAGTVFLDETDEAVNEGHALQYQVEVEGLLLQADCRTRTKGEEKAGGEFKQYCEMGAWTQGREVL
jgi:hypothetical protein